MQQDAELEIPQAPDAEQALIAATILADGRRANDPSEPDVIAEVDGDEIGQHFYVERNRRLWRIMCDRHRRGASNNLVDLAAEARVAGLATDALGLPSSTDLIDWSEGYLRLEEFALGGQIRTWARKIRETSVRRRKAVELDELRRRVLSDARPLGEWFVESTASTLAELEAFRTSAEVDVKSDLYAVLKHVERLAEMGGEQMPGVRSGIKFLDWMLGGFQKGHVTIVAGRPAMGKTAFALSITLNVIRRNRRVGFVSCEMTAQELLRRLVSQLTGIPGPMLLRGPLTRANHAAVVKATAALHAWPLSIIDSHKNWPSIANDCARLVGKGTELLVIDYLGLLDIGGNRPRWEKFTQISGEVKAMAKRLKVPVLLLCQINREFKGESDKRPQLVHLRDSGAVEQDADEVIMLHRPHEYDEKAAEDAAELLVRKNRHGESGKIDVRWHKHIARYADTDERELTLESEPDDPRWD